MIKRSGTVQFVSNKFVKEGIYATRRNIARISHPLRTRLYLYPAILTTEQYRGTVIETGYASTGNSLLVVTGRDLMGREIVIIETDG